MNVLSNPSNNSAGPTNTPSRTVEPNLPTTKGQQLLHLGQWSQAFQQHQINNKRSKLRKRPSIFRPVQQQKAKTLEKTINIPAWRPTTAASGTPLRQWGQPFQHQFWQREAFVNHKSHARDSTRYKLTTINNVSTIDLNVATIDLNVATIDLNVATNDISTGCHSRIIYDFSLIFTIIPIIAKQHSLLRRIGLLLV